MVTPSLGMGGAERVAVVLCEEFLMRGHEVFVVTTTRREDFYWLPQGVERLSLDLSRADDGQRGRHLLWAGTVRRIVSGLLMLRRLVAARNPDVVISFLHDVNALTLFAVGSIAPVIVTEHSTPELGVSFTTGMIRRALYPRAFRLVSVSEDVDLGFRWLPAESRRVIRNPIPHSVARPTPTDWTACGDHFPYIVGMGRLVHEKGIDLLLQAFARATEGLTADWRLKIVGDGELREELHEVARSLNIDERVQFCGALADPFPLLRAARFFVLSSRQEGFGNVQAEAMACGLPVIAFDILSPAAAAVIDGENGLLVDPDNIVALAAALVTLSRDDELRQRLGANARRTATRFHPKTIGEQWEVLFAELSGG